MSETRCNLECNHFVSVSSINVQTLHTSPLKQQRRQRSSLYEHRERCLGRTETRGSTSLPRFAIQFVAGVAEARPGEWKRERVASLASKQQSAKCQQGQPSHLEISVNVELICNSAFKKGAASQRVECRLLFLKRTRTLDAHARIQAR